uniref:Uncharacterized protein n=1 Tax=Panagrolaimus sp. JU765 TaxID=591449 RepID=A0AC34RMV1_9BILA
MEFCPKTGKTIVFELLDDIPLDLTDIYTLNGENLLGVIFIKFDDTYSRKNGRVFQQILKLDRISMTAEVILERRIKFDGVEHTKVGIGIYDTGYIMITGRTPAEQGSGTTAILIAANPLQIEQLPDVNLDKQLADLEGECRNHPSDLFLLPNCVPMLNKFGIFFLVTKIVENNLIFDPHHIGIIYKVGKKWKVEIVQTEGLETEKMMKEVNGTEININYCSMVTQKNHTGWISFIVPKPWNHWRNTAQSILVKICILLIHHVGKPLVKFSRYDGGRLAKLFTDFYTWLVGPTLVPNITPPPDFVLLSLNLKNFTYKFVPVDNSNEIFRKGQSTVMIDSLLNGDVSVTEVAPEYGFVKISKYENPFKIKKLVELCFDFCEMRIPGLRKSYNMKKIGLLQNYHGGCVNFD